MTWVPSASFYVTLMSHAGRLPKPIRFVRNGWMVGMVSVSLPTIPRVGEHVVSQQDPLLYVRWHERVYAKDDQGDDVWWHQRRELIVMGQDMKDSLASSTGLHFFHQLVYRYEQERAQRTQPKNKWAENDGLKLYPTFEWTSQGDLLLNTVNVDAQRQVTRVLWVKTLALKMGWIEEVSTGKYRLGPNVLQEFHSDTIPTPTDVPGGRQQTHVLESGWGLFGVECDVQLAVCEFERDVSSLGGICSDASLARVLQCGQQQHGGQSHHGSLKRNQVPPERHHPL